MKTKIGYKVVRVEGDKLVSTWAEGVFKKEYGVDMWTQEVHEQLPLVLFDDVDVAFGDFCIGDLYRCFKCEYVPSEQSSLVYGLVTLSSYTIEEALEDQKSNGRHINRLEHIVLAKSIKLLEEVTR